MGGTATGSVFKAYDIRGRYSTQIDETFARNLGFALVAHLKARQIAVGRDVRLSAPSISAALCDGIAAAGATAIDLGITTTPMVYYAVGKLGVDGGAMVTASHNPPGDIGFKLCREQASPIGERTGLKDIEALMGRPVPSATPGRIERRSIIQEYRTHLRSFLRNPPKMRIVIDAASGAVAEHFDTLFGDVPGIDWIRLCFPADGRFPNHAPDPLRDENVRDLRTAIVERRADFGVGFDGDGDRCIFFRGDGTRVPCDQITVLLAAAELQRAPASTIVYDLRSSRIVREEIIRLGGFPVRERVGHAFIKERMRREGAVFGGELSGHYYFRDHYFADSGLLAFVKVLERLGSEKRTLEDLLEPLNRTVTTGELNFRVDDKDGTLRKIRHTFSDGRVDELDGVTVEYDRWWFNVRPSNTESLLRLNLEADRPEILADARDRLFEILGTPA